MRTSLWRLCSVAWVRLASAVQLCSAAVHHAPAGCFSTWRGGVWGGWLCGWHWGRGLRLHHILGTDDVLDLCGRWEEGRQLGTRWSSWGVEDKELRVVGGWSEAAHVCQDLLSGSSSSSHEM